MKKQVMTTAHQIARQTRQNFSSYRAAFSVALCKAWAQAKAPSLQLFAEYGHENKVDRALEAIKNGSRFNGKVYGKNIRRGKEQQLSIYVDGKEYFLGAVWKEDVEKAKEEFLNSVHVSFAKKASNPTIFGNSSEGEKDDCRFTAVDHAEFSI